METAKAKFGKRLYNWAMEGWRQEISEDFPLLREVEKTKGYSVHELLQTMKTFEKDQQWIMARALVRRRGHLLFHFGDFNDKDKQLFELYIDMCRKIRDEEALNMIPLRHQRKEPQRKLKRSRLRRSIIESLRPVLGERSESWCSSYECIYITHIGQFKVKTSVDVGGTYHNLAYNHEIMIPGQAPWGGAISLVSWLGIAGGDTMWKDLMEEDVESVTRLLANIIALFMNAVPEFLKDLSV